MRLLVTLPAAAALTLGAGCTRDAPTAPVTEAPAPAAVEPPVVLPSASLADFEAAVQDVGTRVLPELDAAPWSAPVHDALRQLSASLAAGDRAGAEAALSRGRELLSAGAADPEHAAGSGVVQLVLDHAAALLEPSGRVEEM